MHPSQRVGRNEPCPCGSGRKFKLCCLGKNLLKPVSRSPARWAVPGFVGLIVAVAVGKAVLDSVPRNQAKNAPQTAASTGTIPLPTARSMAGGTPQPPGPAPEGKVW